MTEQPTVEAPRRRIPRWVTVVLLVLVAAFWVRIVLFEWVFPVIERQVDNPEVGVEQVDRPES